MCPSLVLPGPAMASCCSAHYSSPTRHNTPPSPPTSAIRSSKWGKSSPHQYIDPSTIPLVKHQVWPTRLQTYPARTGSGGSRVTSASSSFPIRNNASRTALRRYVFATPLPTLH
eukprot:jgi/Botrbrau1/7771/Bobra.0159s0199.1